MRLLYGSASVHAGEVGEGPLFFVFSLWRFLAMAGKTVGMAVSVENLEHRIHETAIPIAKALQIDLIDVRCHGRGPGMTVRVTIDKPGGVGIDDCEQLHHSLSRALDVVDPVPHAYRLEVSSPGLDRPLKDQQDFRRSIDKLVRITLTQPWRGEWVVVGCLQAVRDHEISLAVQTRSGTQSLALAWESIAKARLEVEW